MIKQNKKFDNITDNDLVTLVVNGDALAVEFMFYQKCEALFQHLICTIFKNDADKDELVNEFYLYLSRNEWSALKSFNGSSKLTTWLSVVATRFFIKIRSSIIENDKKETLNDKEIKVEDNSFGINNYELYDAINKMPNARFRLILLSELQGEPAEDTINKLGVKSGNFYNLRHQARQQLSAILKEGDYVRK